MDPVSITGLVGTCISLVANTAKTIKNLNDLKSKFSEVAVEIAHLLSQVSTIQASVQLIQKWLDRGPASLHSNAELSATIEQALDDCIVIISALERHVSRIAYAGGVVPVQGKIRHIFGEEELATNQRALGYQVQALTLLLQAIQMTSVVEQQQLLAREETRAVLRRARDDASSYVDLSGEQLSVFQGTITSDGGADLDAVFDFDDLALDSHAYRSAFRSFMKKEYEDRGKQERSESVIPDSRLFTDPNSLPSSKPSYQLSTGPSTHNIETNLPSRQLSGPPSPSSFRWFQDKAEQWPDLPLSRPPDLSSIPVPESTLEESQAPYKTEGRPSNPVLKPEFDNAKATSCDSLDGNSRSETRASSESAIYHNKLGGRESQGILPNVPDSPTLHQGTHQTGTESQDMPRSTTLDRGLIPDTEYWGARPLGVLRIHIIGATNIRSSSFSRSKPDSYVRIIESGRAEGQTRVWKDSDAPEYDEVFHIPLIGIDSTVRLEVMESRRLLPDQCLGFIDLGVLDDFLPGEAGNLRTASFRDIGEILQTANGITGGLLRFQLEFYFSDRTAFRYPPRLSALAVGRERLLTTWEDNLYSSGLFTFSLDLLEDPVNLRPPIGRVFFHIYVNDAASPSHIIDTRITEQNFQLQRFCYIPDLRLAKIRIEVWKRALIGVVEKDAREWIMETRGWLGYPIELRDVRLGREGQPMEFEFKTCFLPVDTWTQPEDYSCNPTKGEGVKPTANQNP